MSQLKVHQKIVTEAEKDKNELMEKVLRLEQMVSSLSSLPSFHSLPPSYGPPLDLSLPPLLYLTSSLSPSLPSFTSLPPSLPPSPPLPHFLPLSLPPLLYLTSSLSPSLPSSISLPPSLSPSLPQMLHGREDINESLEFKKAVEQEQARIRQETESQYESKLAALESEKKR